MSADTAQFHLHLSTRGSAFADNPAAEVARVLRELADVVAEQGMPAGAVLRIKDVNGNRVGYATTHSEQWTPTDEGK